MTPEPPFVVANPAEPAPQRDDRILRNLVAARLDMARLAEGVLDGLERSRAYSRVIVALLKRHAATIIRAHGIDGRDLSILAVGGTGRRELVLNSDLDLCFLFRREPGELEAAFIRAVLQPLYDLRIPVGHSARTLADVAGLAGTDIKSVTSYIGARHLVGARDLSADALSVIDEIARRTHRRWFLQELLRLGGSRRSGDGTVFSLEPHLKESPGALRDVQSLRWYAFALRGRATFDALATARILSSIEVETLRVALSYFLRLRNALHATENAAKEVVRLDQLPILADRLGETTRSPFLVPQEALLQSYYLHASRVAIAVRRIESHVCAEVSRHDAPPPDARRDIQPIRFEARAGALVLANPRDILRAEDAGWMIDYFSVGARESLAYDEQTLALISSRSRTFRDAAQRLPANRERLLAILRLERGAYRALSAMHECGVLTAYIPEFEHVEHLPRLDQFHRYTVDEHLLRSVRAAEDLRDPAGPDADTHLGAVARQILRYDLLKLTLLLHDIGKGAGPGHIIRGAQLATVIGERIGLPDCDTGLVRKTIENHHKMSHIVTRREPGDPTSATELAEAVGEPEALRLLYVHTACDMRAVGPGRWNDWHAQGLRLLYDTTLAKLRGENPPPPVTNITQIVAKAEALEPDERRGIDPAELEHFVKDMPDRYRRTVSVREMMRHMRLWRGLAPHQFVAVDVTHRPGANYLEIVCVGRDTRGLFTHLCGAIASRRYNILSAQLFTSRTGICVDLFQISAPEDAGSLGEDVVERMERKLNRVLAGQAPPDWNLPPAPTPVYRPDERHPIVRFDNETDRHHTLVEIKAPDRPGLLWRVANVFDRHKVNVELALISTEAYRVVDVFYVTDWETNKLTGENTLAALEADLLAALGDNPPPVHSYAPVREADE